MDCFSCFREPGFERLSNSLETQQEQEQEEEDRNQACTFPDKPLMMLRSSWKKGKRLQLQEKKPKQDAEDWVMAFSLLKNKGNDNNIGFHFKLSSMRVFPYLKTENNKDDVAKVISMEAPLQNTQSSKPKKKNKDKRVTFRLPEEADIFVFEQTPQEEEEEGTLYVF